MAPYLVDIDGTRLLRLAGSEEFPAELEAPLAIGPEIPREGLPQLRELIDAELPGSVMAPLLLPGRAHGVLLAVDARAPPLVQLARQAAAALALADVYTDVFDTTRRRRRPVSRRRFSRICCRRGSRESRAGSWPVTCCRAMRSVVTGLITSRTATALGSGWLTAWARGRRRPRWRLTTRCSRSPCRARSSTSCLDVGPARRRCSARSPAGIRRRC